MIARVRLVNDIPTKKTEREVMVGIADRKNPRAKLAAIDKEVCRIFPDEEWTNWYLIDLGNYVKAGNLL